VTVRTEFDDDQLPIVGKNVYEEDEVWGFNQASITSQEDRQEPSTVITTSYILDEQFTGEIPFSISEDGDSRQQISTVTFQDDDQFGFRQQFVIAADDSLEQLSGYKYLQIDDIETFGFKPPIEIGADDSPEQLPGYKYFQIDEVDGLANTYVHTLAEDFIDENIIIPWQVQQDDTVPFGQKAPFLQTLGLQAEEMNFPNPPYPITYQTEFDQVGLNPPFIISQPFAWEESGVPPNPPFPVVDEYTFNGMEVFVPSRVAVFASGKVVGAVLDSGQVLDFNTASSIDEVVDATGNTIGYVVSGKVTIIKGGN
jgi:hypothetical protein